jgi:voltage-gated potassium channel
MGISVRRQVHEILEPDHENSRFGDIINILLILLIIANVIAFVLETDVSLFLQYGDFFIGFEIFSIGIFTIEYGLRLWSCVEDPIYQEPVTGRLRWMITFYAIIDFLAFAPFYLPLAIPVDLRVLRIMRLFRIFRILKLGRYSTSFTLMRKVIFDKKYDIIVAIFVLSIVLILTSSGMYFAENAAQPDKFSSIPESMWYSVITLSTVGYGDVYPITPTGKILASVIALLGVAFFALPAGIITSGYVESIKEVKKPSGKSENEYLLTKADSDSSEQNDGFICEHCGKRNKPR